MPKPVKASKIAQAIVRDWCKRYGLTVEVEMASTLVQMMTFAIEAERASLNPNKQGR